MKKLLTAILLVTLMLMTIIVPASAAEGNLSYTASLSSNKTSFTVSVLLKDNPGVITLQSHLTYDSKVLKLKSANNGEIFEDVFVASQKLTDMPYNMLWMDATSPKDITKKGVLATYTFEVLKDAPVGQTEIKIDVVDAVNAKTTDVKINGCSFKVNVTGAANNSASNEGDAAQNGDQTATNSGANNDANKDVAANDDNVINVEIPDENTVSEEVIEEITSENQETADETTISSEITEKEDSQDSGNKALLPILIIAGVLVVGGAATAIIVISKKKSK